MPQFEWDQRKSDDNQRKHGVSFAESLVLWDHMHIEVTRVAYAKSGETRNATMGWIGDKLHVAIWTPRQVCIRLISVRRARTYEEEIFHKAVSHSG